MKNSNGIISLLVFTVLDQNTLYGIGQNKQ